MEYSREMGIIARRIEIFYKLKENEIYATTRQRRVSYARYMAYLVIKTIYRDIPVTVIARFFGKTHGTVIHGIKKLESEITMYRSLNGEFVKVMNVVRYSLEDHNDFLKANDNKCLPWRFDLVQTTKTLRV